ncbi:MAG: hypothetical protein JWO98_3237, partial [Frankiales bacterium]|nr:hypothetical protein [Frankiales bacterium]
HPRAAFEEYAARAPAAAPEVPAARPAPSSDAPTRATG